MLDTGVLAALAPVVTALITGLFMMVSNKHSVKVEESKSAAQSMGAANDEWQELYRELRDRVQSQSADIETMKNVVAQLEEREYRMLRDLDAVFKWIEDGAVPPPPVRPTYLPREDFLR